MILIGLAGRARVGKDTTADYLILRHRFIKMAFADYLKQVAELGGWNGLKDERGRRYLQHLGDTMREYEPNIFVNEIRSKIAWCERYGNEPRIVVSDVRLVTEIEALKKIGAQVWLIKRNVIGAQAHQTEMLDENSYKFDYVFDNNGSFDQLYSGIDQAITEHAKKD